MWGAVIVMTPFERALVGELEGSHGDRVHVGDVHGATALHHYAGLNFYEHLEKTGYDEHQASIFLVRTLFCLYADDSGLWERDLFSRYIEERTSADGSDLGAQLATLYQALSKPEDKRYG